MTTVASVEEWSNAYRVLHVRQVDCPDQSDHVHVRHSQVRRHKVKVDHLQKQTHAVRKGNILVSQKCNQ